MTEHGEGGLAEDYAALRHDAGGRLVARDVMRVAGPDAESYLQGQCSQDIAGLVAGGCADALLLTPQGKLDALVRVTRLADDEFLLDVDGGLAPAVVARLERFKLRVKVTVEPLAYLCVSLRGPNVVVPADSGAVVVLAFSWGAVSGFDLLGPAVEVPADIRHCGHGAWEALRVEAGIPAMGAELDDRTIAAEADLL
ncbi:MAG: YgfZ/GcvT domain-containing protein, partial [Acidimicrobiales bacterium]